MACSGLCEACLASKTPSATGTCDDIDADTDPDMECIGATLCDGAGVCELLSNGTSCSQNGECMSNFCVDGVCCNNACPGACEACNLGGSIGTCTDRAAGAAGSPSCAPYLCDGNNGTCPNTCVDSGDCSAGNYCNASNNCVAQQANGSMCGDPEECTSGNCVDGFCCNSACGGVCQACDGDMTAGAAGTCSFINSGADPENECPGPQTCDGAGACM